MRCVFNEAVMIFTFFLQTVAGEEKKKRGGK
jgi:hypothetical protein